MIKVVRHSPIFSRAGLQSGDICQRKQFAPSGHIKWMHDRIGWHQEGGVWVFTHINCWSLLGAFDYVDEPFDVWRERSCHAWQLDISGLGTQGIKRLDEAAAKGDNIPAEDQLSLEFVVPPVATGSTVVPAVGEQESISGNVRKILKGKPVTRSSSVWPVFWSVCQRGSTR